MPKSSRNYECQKCHEEFPYEECVDILFVQRGLGGEKHQLARIRLCGDCAEKAETVLADALELPDWD